jgi:hypothetical protein
MSGNIIIKKGSSIDLVDSMKAGSICEYIAKRYMVQNGYDILIPCLEFSNNVKADFIAYKPEGPIVRIQVKSLRIQKYTTPKGGNKYYLYNAQNFRGDKYKSIYEKYGQYVDEFMFVYVRPDINMAHMWVVPVVDLQTTTFRVNKDNIVKSKEVEIDPVSWNVYNRLRWMQSAIPQDTYTQMVGGIFNE